MSKLIFAVLAIWATLSGQSSAASLSFYFSGIVTGDTTRDILGIPGTGNFQVSTVPTYAVGDAFHGVETFTDTTVNTIANSSFTGQYLFQTGQSASLNIFFQGVAGPYTLVNGLEAPASSAAEAAILSFSPAVFSSTLYAFFPEADVSQNSALFLSANGTAIQASLELGAAGSATFGRTLTLDVTSLSTVPLPPALPMFAFGLLALGICGFVSKRRRFAEA